MGESKSGYGKPSNEIQSPNGSIPGYKYGCKGKEIQIMKKKHGEKRLEDMGNKRMDKERSGIKIKRHKHRHRGD